ncbi:MAG: UvrD-helicase domain-containing protein, partial [Bacteroidales bacterium]|nr:UvrD-helicase domain-containing protein [Bacteroidales bacterium]
MGNTLEGWIDNPEKWVNKGDFSRMQPHLTALNEILKKISVLCSSDEGRLCNDASLLIKNLPFIGFYDSLRKKIDSLCRQDNTVLLSSTNNFLRDIIDGGDIPFVYERIGGSIDHYLLDEFQDTSALQWENLLPLLRDSLDRGQTNLIVGDVKQSIYRFRNADWELLHNRVLSDLKSYIDKPELLDKNWRSARQVVEFNNRFFSFLTEEVGGESDKFKELKEIYEDVRQEYRKDAPEGCVKVGFYESASMVERVPELVQSYLDRGFKQSEITVLVKSNADGNEISQKLIEKGYGVITEESVSLSQNNAVQTIVAILRYHQNESDSMGKYILDSRGVNIGDGLDSRSIYSLCEEIISKIGDMIKPQDNAFIHLFLDYVLEYVSKQGGSLSAFLDWWDSVGSGKSIALPEGEDAVKVMTIHKSKGLEFPVVILPFVITPVHGLDKGIVWCSDSEHEPLDALPLFPVSYKADMLKGSFSKNYEKELFLRTVDTINRFYVACTRASVELNIMAGEVKKEGKKLNNFLQTFCRSEA